MTLPAAGRRRGLKSWFVEPYRQVKLGLLFLIINLFFASLIIAIFGYYVWDIFQAVSTYFKLSPDQSAVALNKFQQAVFMGLGLIVLFVLTTIMVSVKYTHQIYGPLVSIHRFLDDLLAGKRPEPLQLRESDQLKDLAYKLNVLSETLQPEQRQTALLAIYRYLEQLNHGTDPGPLRLRDDDHLKNLEEQINLLREQYIVKSKNQKGVSI